MKEKNPPIVLLHAFPLSSRMWKEDAAFLSAKTKVFNLDLPGFGSSSPMEGVTMPGMAAEIGRELDRSGVREPVFMAGLSMGGYAAFEFLRQFPERLCGLGLFATRASADAPAALKNRALAIEAIEKFGIEPFARKAVKSQLGKTSQEQNPSLVENVLSMMREASPQAAMDALKAMAGRSDLNSLLPSIRFPVLAAAGEEDEICPAAEMKAMHEKIPGSRFHVIPRSGHLINLENTPVFRKIFMDFLEAEIFSRP